MEIVTHDESITSVTFGWARAGDGYIVQGPQVLHKGGGVSPYRPVIGGLALSPGKGKFFYEITTNTDACKLGLCTEEAFRTDGDLQELSSANGATFPHRVRYRLLTIAGFLIARLPQWRLTAGSRRNCGVCLSLYQAPALAFSLTQTWGLFNCLSMTSTKALSLTLV
ncbi:hypothetical protein C4B63_57g110 [Trypanosoma cruzi]|uniref:Uncharacterized protein n=1 Tax=Trypanosoma cruzi TaxID=5693 RepID=A0A2V2V2E2_TRYCR|nr:hypothetical protein C4B63_57g110 [Trypanosoma cruzi]